MSGTIELDRDGKMLLIGFPYREDLVDEVRNLPGRRWDRGSKMWKVPIEHAELAVSTLMKHGFEMSSDVMGILAGTGPQTAPVAGAPPAGSPAAGSPAAGVPGAAGATGTQLKLAGDTEDDAASKDGLRVSELNERARTALRDAFSGTIRVIGEVVDFDKNRERQHIFFTLAEKDAAGHRIAATVSVAMFERTAKRVLAKVERQGLTMHDGVQIMIEAKVDLYPANGRFQLILEDIRPEFTLGKLALDREAVLKALRDADLDERNASLPWPLPSLRLGVLTSPTSDGWNDFLREMEASEIGFQISMYPVKVQGDGLAPSVLAGLAWFAERKNDFDVICIIRGGGSRTDLAWFDNKDVAFAVARHPLKVLCGIGHERDSSILDEIAASRKTPTAVAAYLIGQVEAVGDDLHDQTLRLRDEAQRVVRASRQDLTNLAHGLRRTVDARLIRERSRLHDANRRVVAGTQNLVGRATQTLATATSRLAAGTRHAVDRATQTLRVAQGRLRQGTERRLEREKILLDGTEKSLRLLNPERVLQRGYAMVRTSGDANQDSRIITSQAQLETDQPIRIVFRDGYARATVHETRASENTSAAEESPGSDTPQD